MALLTRTVPAAIALLLLTSCAQVSITGPCVVQSNSSITLDVEWTTQTSVPAGVAQAGVASAMTTVVTRMNGAPSGRPLQIRTNAAGDSVTIMMEVPSTWSETAVSATIDGVPVTPVGSADPAYCGDFLGLPRAGYVRRFYLMTPAAPLAPEASGTFQVSYATGTIADGVYHPAVFFSVEPETEPCVPSTSFHRVTAGTLKFVNFDLSSSFNADTVVNGTDVVQDPLVTLTTDTGTARLSLATESFLAGSPISLPDDGLLTPGRYALQADGLALELPECLPSVQLGWSEAADGNNTWLQQAEGDSLVVDVPDAHYAELLLYVTPSMDDPSSTGSTPDALFRAMRVEMTYEDASSTQVATLLPLLGLPITFPALAADAPDLVPSFTMALGTMTAVDGSSETSPVPVPMGIAAMLVTPDSSKRLVSVRITPFRPDLSSLPGQPAATAGGPRSEAALEPVLMAVYGMAGMQLVPDLSVQKTILTPAPHLVGDAVTYRITVTNSGNAPSTAVTVTDNLEAQLAFVSATASDGSCNEAAGVVTCSLGEIAPGASETVDVVADIVAAGPFSNTAVAAMTGGEDDTTDNAATVAAVAVAPNLAVTKTVQTPGPYHVGANITYRITVTNDGTADSTAVTLTDALPANLVFASAAASDGTCNQAGGTVTCSLGNIAAGASETVDIVATIHQPGSITNTGTASMEGGEADPTDNTGRVTITATAATFTDVPALSEWALLLLASLLGVVALLRARS